MIYKYRQQEINEDNEHYLKRKLIETHQKLIKQIDFNKQLEDQISNLLKKNQNLLNQNQDLKEKCSQFVSKSNNQGQYNNKFSSQTDHKIKELTNKNQLLRNDLEQVRNRLLNEFMAKNTLQQKVKDRDLKLYQSDQNYKKCLNELKKKQNEIILMDSQYKSIQQKYQHLLQQLKKIKSNLEQSKINQQNLLKRNQQLQYSLKIEKQKIISITTDYKIISKQLKQSKYKIESQLSTIQQLKNQIFLLKKQKSQTYSPNHLILQKLTQEMNFMASIYRQKQKKLHQISQKSNHSYQKKINNSFDAKDLVQKLEAEQRERLNQRKFDLNSAKKLSQKKQAKEKYDVSQLQNIILDNNISKNKILHHIDKIDQTKVKTNELLFKKKKLYDQIAKIQQVTQNARKKLRGCSHK